MATRKHGTLTATVVATVSIGAAPDSISVINRGTVDIFATVNGTDPTVNGDDTFAVPAGGYRSIRVANDSDGTVAVKLISSGTPAYSVEVD